MLEKRISLWYNSGMKKMLVRFKTVVISLFLAALFLGSCRGIDPYFSTGSFSNDRVLHTLFRMLDGEKDEMRFVIVKQIASLLLEKESVYKQILFLTDYVEKNPFDPYNSYYLLLVAESYEAVSSSRFAVHYYRRILRNHPDLVIAGKNIHYLCLTRLLSYIDDDHERIECYKQLLSRFSDQLDDKAKVYYALAKAYEATGERDQAMNNYIRFINQPNSGFAEDDEVRKDVRKKIQIANSDLKQWTVEDLDFLVNEIRRGLLYKEYWRLDRYKARANFFAVPWDQMNYDSERSSYFNLNNFVRVSDVRVEEELDIDSNSSEAFLRTSRWAYYPPVWYFYFRRIEFPMDPELDGRWEWAGIYFGEKR